MDTLMKIFYTVVHLSTIWCVVMRGHPLLALAIAFCKVASCSCNTKTNRFDSNKHVPNAKSARNKRRVLQTKSKPTWRESAIRSAGQQALEKRSTVTDVFAIRGGQGRENLGLSTARHLRRTSEVIAYNVTDVVGKTLKTLNKALRRVLEHHDTAAAARGAAGKCGQRQQAIVQNVLVWVALLGVVYTWALNRISSNKEVDAQHYALGGALLASTSLQVVSNIATVIKRRKSTEQAGVQQPIPAGLSSFRWWYLGIFAVYSFADALVTPYLMVFLGEKKPRIPHEMVGVLVVCERLSCMAAGLFYGGLVDRHGRRKACIMWPVLSVAFCLLVRSSNFSMLMLACIIHGAGSSLGTTCFESWMVAEHNLRRYSSSLLPAMFRLVSWAGNLSWITAGFVVAGLRSKAKDGFLAASNVSIVLSITTGLLIWRCWSENYGDRTSSSSQHTRQALRRITGDTRLLLTAVVAVLFEGGMNAFFPVCFACLKRQDKGIAEGVVVSTMIISACGGTALFKLLTEGLPHPLVFSPETCLLMATGLSTVVLAQASKGPSFPTMLCLILVFEACIGLFTPAIATCRARYIADDVRGTVMGLLRVPTMLVTALVLSVVMSPKEESMSDGEALAVKAPFILSAVAVLAGGATVAQALLLWLYGGVDGQPSGERRITQNRVDVEVDARSHAHSHVAHGGDNGRWSARAFGGRHRSSSGAGANMKHEGGKKAHLKGLIACVSSPWSSSLDGHNRGLSRVKFAAESKATVSRGTIVAKGSQSALAASTASRTGTIASVDAPSACSRAKNTATQLGQTAAVTSSDEPAVKQGQNDRSVEKSCTRETFRAAAVTTADAALRSLSLVARTEVGDADIMSTAAQDETQQSTPNPPGIADNEPGGVDAGTKHSNPSEAAKHLQWQSAQGREKEGGEVNRHERREEAKERPRMARKRMNARVESQVAGTHAQVTPTNSERSGIPRSSSSLPYGRACATSNTGQSQSQSYATTAENAWRGKVAALVSTVAGGVAATGLLFYRSSDVDDESCATSQPSGTSGWSPSGDQAQHASGRHPRHPSWSNRWQAKDQQDHRNRRDSCDATEKHKPGPVGDHLNPGDDSTQRVERGLSKRGRVGESSNKST